ncbi:MAG: WecB/TagA/CpsF family glycosyltransferase [Synergistaceae bacterium]|nr:WecB/TagA/CpsF family glycosyltransferase [Synergistaceae bacterium]MBR0168745.1 WecB/TagA/CpsF family glycosyltransferase [Synergistaceae bacterium]
MQNNIFVIIGCVSMAVICIVIQKYIKTILDARQYGYMRDIVLAGAFMILALWFGSRDAKIVVAGAMLATFTGISENIYNDSRWRLLYPLIGFICTYYGPDVHFIRFPDGEYIYLTPAFSLIAGTIWFTFFPFIFRYMDEIPGLTGHVLAVTFVLMMSACIATGSGEFFMSFAGMMMLAAFWSRFGNVYRQAGKALSSMWGFLVAGTSIMGSTKGIVLSTVLFLSLGLFAIPAAEILVSFVKNIMTDSDSHEGGKIYGGLLKDGVEHPEAVQSVAGLCALTSMAAAWEKWTIAAVIVVCVMIFRHAKRKKSPLPPSLWGVNFDNVSMNYAVSKARGMIQNPDSQSAKLIVTLNAIGMETVIDDEEFSEVVEWSSMKLADGSGLCAGMRILGRPVQERVAGIDFAENLCRNAAAEGWPVYFCGAAGDTAVKCAEMLQERFEGLVIAGARDGYFDVRDETVPEAIASSGAKILLVAMGQPRQEKWVYRHREKLKGILCVGVGGAFDVFSGNLLRAPLWVQRIGFEWLYRMLQEPGRWRKNLRLITFMMRIFASRLGLYRK